MIDVRRARQADSIVLGDIHASSREATYASFFEPEFAARSVASRAQLGRLLDQMWVH